MSDIRRETVVDRRDPDDRRRGSSPLLWILLALAALLAIAFATGLLDIDQTKNARLPEVNVSGGQAPGFDVDTGNVVVGTKETTVDVPKIETEKETIDVPVIGVQKANNDNKE